MAAQSESGPAERERESLSPPPPRLSEADAANGRVRRLLMHFRRSMARGCPVQELSAKLQEPVWTRLQKPREPKKEEPTPVAAWMKHAASSHPFDECMAWIMLFWPR